MKKYLSLLCIGLFSFAVFLPAKACIGDSSGLTNCLDNTNTQTSQANLNTTTQALIKVLTQLLQQLELQLQTLLAQKGYNNGNTTNTTCPSGQSWNAPLNGCVGGTNLGSAPVITSFNGKAGSMTQGSTNIIYGQNLNNINSVYLTSLNNPDVSLVSLGYSYQSDGSVILNLPNSPQISNGQYYLYVSTQAATSQPYTVSVAGQQCTIGQSWNAPLNGCVGGSTQNQNNSFTVSLSSGVAPLTVQFQNTIQSAGDESIDYGDGTSCSTANPGFVDQSCNLLKHTYTTPGTYTAILYRHLPTTELARVTINVFSSTQNQPSITSIYPISGQVGTQVTISGSGFAAANNFVYFGNQIISNVSSSNSGTSIMFNIPSASGLCTASGGVCPTYQVATTPGVYQVKVGIQPPGGVTSNSLNFTVISQ